MINKINLLSYSILLSLFIVMNSNACTGHLDETRYCGSPERDINGVIIRNSSVIKAYRRVHPCPSTLLFSDSCPGWSINHIIPLACGGCDSVSNLVWMPNSIKTCTTSHCVDQYERKISASYPPQPDTNNCINQIVH